MWGLVYGKVARLQAQVKAALCRERAALVRETGLLDRNTAIYRAHAMERLAGFDAEHPEVSQ
jgi:hypothetical protein